MPTMTRRYVSIANWEKFQHYNDRTPPWIKLYNSLLDDYEFSCLHDASKLLLMMLWLLASRHENKIPADIKWLKKQLPIDGDVDIKPLIEQGFIIDASNALAVCKQDACLETEKETEGEKSITSKFDAFWEAYPKKVEKKRARQKWVSRKLDRIADQILADIQARKEKDRKWLEGYIPNPTTYINGDRWEDAIESAEKVPTDHVEIRKLMTANNIDPRGKDWSWHECRRQVAMATGMQL